MKTLLKLEELAMFLLAFASLGSVNVEWWWYLLLLIGPDISMLGYLAGNKIGAYSYNFFHHKGVAIVIIISGFVLSVAYRFNNTEWLINAGVVMFGHSSMDRFFGYGLKTEEGFKFTHLGKIGKDETSI